MEWELHCHSYYSKGTKIPWEGLVSPRDVIKAAKFRGLGGIALTDHSSIKGWSEAREEAKKQDIVFVPGMEIKSRAGHVIGLGLNDSVPDHRSLEETVERIHGQGGLAVAPHPFDIKGDGIRHGMKKTDAVEVFNALAVDRLSNMFCEKKAEESGMPRVVGSDAHTYGMIGFAKNIIRAHDADSMMRQIKKGKVRFEKNYIPLSFLTEWARERLTRSYMDVVSYANYNYSSPKAWLAKKMLRRFVFSKSSSWNALAGFGLGVSTMYSGIKLFSYY